MWIAVVEAIGEYRIKKTIGKGAFGVVYQVVCVPRNSKQKCTYYAIKASHIRSNPNRVGGAEDQDLRLAEKEAMLMKELDHPHIVSYLDSFRIDNIFYFVMEFAPQGDLQGLISKRKRAKKQFITDEEPRSFIADCFCQIASAVRYLHSVQLDSNFHMYGSQRISTVDERQHGILHRDIKPENVVLFPAPGSSIPVCKLLDFGTARSLKHEDEFVSTVIGTALYKSPEALTKGRYSFPADIWGLGCILFEMW